MSYNNILNAAVETFKQNFSTFCQKIDYNIDTLDEAKFKMISQGLLDAAQAAGKAGLLQFLHDHDTLSPTLSDNNVMYRYKGKSINEILTLFGTISIYRAMYYNEKDGGSYLFPLDLALGLYKDDFATLETREMLLFASSSLTPQELHDLLKKCSLCCPSRTAIQNIINKDGECMEGLREEIAEKVLEDQGTPQQTQTLVASLDGVNVLLREPGKKKGRKITRPREDGSEDDTEPSPTSYHNAMVGAISYYGVGEDDKARRLASIYTARMPEEKAIVFKEDFERMVHDTSNKIEEEGKDVHKVLLVDGHLMIKGFARKSTVLKPFKKLIDFYHTTEHLSKASEAMYGSKSEHAQWWYAKWRKALKKDENAPNNILRSMEGFLSRHDLPQKRREDLETEIRFFSNNKKYMTYADFLKQRLPIGSGPIEAAAKSIVKQRMCRSGMMWSREKGQYVLTVRSYVKSGQWERAWEHYKELKNAA